MGTISEKLTYLNGTKGKLKDSINKFRDGITDQTKFRDYATELDGIYDKLPKVDNTNDASQLLNAQNGLLDDFKMYGNTQQDTYTGKNLLNTSNEYPVGYSTTINGITFTINNDKTIIANGTATGENARFTFIENGTILGTNKKITAQLISGTISGQCTFFAYDSAYENAKTSQVATDGSVNNTTLTTNVEYAKFRLTVYAGATVNNAKFGLMVINSDETNTTYEPYVGGTPSPNPDYPQNINVVSGNQTINVSGKNLFDGLVEEGQYNTSTGAKQVGTNLRSANYISVNPNSTIKFSIDGESKAINILEYKGDYTFIQYTNVSANNTITLTNETKFITLYRGAGDGSEKWQIEYGSSATSYEPYYTPQNYTIGLGSMELCKIDTYKDSIKKSTGKNLAYNFENIWYSTTSNTFTNNSNFKSCKAKVKPNTTYTISKKNVSNRYIVFASEVDIVAGAPLGRLITQDPSLTNYTFTTQNNENYIFFGYISSTDAEAIAKAEEEIMIEEGSTATDYEPFGTDWYIKKEIGKVVLDGSESWGYGGTSTPNVFYTTVITDYATSNNIPYSNYYIGNTNVNGASGMSSLANNTIAFINVSGGTTPRFYIKDTKYTLSADLKTWLETHNLIVYYALITPTYETITNETLISQLESIKVNTGSNYFTLSNSNNVLPTLYVSRLKELGKLE